MILKPLRDLHHRQGRERELRGVVKQVVWLLKVLKVVRATPYTGV